ncbi:MAG TPA: ATP-dependent sacrificial sulfur transferase LarE [Thermodesulfobacteriota bacterium]|nr:ATP-dependent sacrificial sulfur transferase LarE [Thermodesulfobacteriota bacterium]
MLSSEIIKIKNSLKTLQPGAVAFSGGVDSTLLLYLCREVWEKPPLALTFLSPLLTPPERERIQDLTRRIGADLVWMKTKEYRDPDFKKNTKQRCYVCKKSRLAQAKGLLRKKEISFLLDGTNADDLKTYRPGIRAAREVGVISPLAREGWSKEDIRRVSRKLGLPTWNLPSSPCLASRVAYGYPITLPLLRRLYLGEEVLLKMGFSQYRLRYHGPLVRIEVPEKEQHILIQGRTRQELLSRLTALGFTYVTLDLKGFRSGSMDEVLK